MRRNPRVLPATALAVVLAGPATAEAARPPAPSVVPRIAWVQMAPPAEVRTAYQAAMDQFNNLELDAALATLDAAIARAQAQGLSADPALAPLFVLRGGIIYSNTGDAAQTLVAFDAAVRADYYIALPIELRSEELSQLLDQARANVAAPPAAEPIEHVPPAPQPGQDVEIQAHMRVTMLEGFQAALYWRPAGSQQYRSVAMETFGNLAWSVIPAAQHGNKPIEYAIYAFDANQQPIANKGDTERPLKIEFAEAAKEQDGGKKDDADSGKADREKKKKPRGPSDLPRFFLNVGIGTGMGVANGTAELTFRQFRPDKQDFVYTTAEQACAIARWWGADRPSLGRMKADLPDPVTFQTETLPQVMAAGALGNLDPDELAAGYDPDACAQRHPVSTGLAVAPFHIAPEFGFRVGNNVVLSVYGRLQVVTGSRVYRGDDPLQQNALDAHYNQTIRNPVPEGIRQRPPFTWAVGGKFKYLFLPGKKVRPFVGAIAGGGFARLMVNMGFADDRNGNSVPDNFEVPLETIVEPISGNTSCLPVWPYSEGCTGGSPDYNLAFQVADQAGGERRDTVVLGAGFVGPAFGFHAQLHKNFALYGEVDLGVWFPRAASLLIDVTLGPSITF